MKHKKLICWNAAAILLLIVFSIVAGHISGVLYSMQTAKRWKGESELHFAHLACFFPDTAGKTAEDVDTLRELVERTLLENGLTSEQGQLYADAYSAFGDVTAEGEHGKAELSAVFVGGNFFVFHPLRLISGGYISEQDLMKDRVVLDELAAWQLFGGTDVAGLFIEIDGNRYYVAGVIARDEDYASQKVQDERPTIYLSYNTNSGVTDQTITSYEIVLPEPVKDFGVGLVKERFADEDADEVINQTKRYSVSSLWTTFWGIGERMIGGSGIVYPQWEKAIRLTEFHLSLLLAAMVFCSVLPVVTTVVLLTKIIYLGVKKAKHRIPTVMERIVEERKEMNYRKKAGDTDWLELP